MGLPLAVRIGTPSASTISPFSFRRSMGRVYQLALVGLTMDIKKVYRSDGRGRYREQSHKVSMGQSTTIAWRGN